VIDCLDEVEGIEERENGESNFIFDPEEFLRQVPTPTVPEYQLDVDRLQELAIQGSQIRAQIENKAKELGRRDDWTPEEVQQHRSRRGLTLSVASRDPERKSEKERRVQTLLETLPVRQYKPCRRKSLTSDVQLEIVDMYVN
jgi:hypothetical protein